MRRKVKEEIGLRGKMRGTVLRHVEVEITAIRVPGGRTKNPWRMKKRGTLKMKSLSQATTTELLMRRVKKRL